MEIYRIEEAEVGDWFPFYDEFLPNHRATAVGCWTMQPITDIEWVDDDWAGTPPIGANKIAQVTLENGEVLRISSNADVIIIPVGRD